MRDRAVHLKGRNRTGFPSSLLTGFLREGAAMTKKILPDYITPDYGLYHFTMDRLNNELFRILDLPASEQGQPLNELKRHTLRLRSNNSYASKTLTDFIDTLNVEISSILPINLNGIDENRGKGIVQFDEPEPPLIKNTDDGYPFIQSTKGYKPFSTIKELVEELKIYDSKFYELRKTNNTFQNKIFQCEGEKGYFVHTKNLTKMKTICKTPQ